MIFIRCICMFFLCELHRKSLAWLVDFYRLGVGSDLQMSGWFNRVPRVSLPLLFASGLFLIVKPSIASVNPLRVCFTQKGNRKW